MTVELEHLRIDLVPIARLPLRPERAANLFHYNFRKQESYHKEVNPWAFSQYFNDTVKTDPRFARSFHERALLVEAAAAPLPDQIPVQYKSARVVALQLLKRNRDINYLSREERKPPSIVLAAMSLQRPVISGLLIDELISIADLVKTACEASVPLHVNNPAYPQDIFTDRWPMTVPAQRLFATDLRRMLVSLRRLRNEELSIQGTQDILQEMFGEQAAEIAIDYRLESRRRARDAGKLSYGTAGRVLAPAAVSSLATPARSSTFTGGEFLDEID